MNRSGLMVAWVTAPISVKVIRRNSSSAAQSMLASNGLLLKKLFEAVRKLCPGVTNRQIEKCLCLRIIFFRHGSEISLQKGFRDEVVGSQFAQDGKRAGVHPCFSTEFACSSGSGA